MKKRPNDHEDLPVSVEANRATRGFARSSSAASEFEDGLQKCKRDGLGGLLAAFVESKNHTVGPIE
jgi:hypothetical protein